MGAPRSVILAPESPIALARRPWADLHPAANFIAPFILDPNNSDRMLAGGTSLWRSNDVKTATTPTWTSIKAPVSNGLIPPSNIPISAIAVAEGNSDFVVVGHNTGEIFLTSDGTAAAPTWTKIDTAAVPNRFLTRLAVDASRSPNWIYATFGGFSPDNVYVTKDLGATWTDVTGSGTTALPDLPVRSLTIHPVRPDYLLRRHGAGYFRFRRCRRDLATTPRRAGECFRR